MVNRFIEKLKCFTPLSEADVGALVDATNWKRKVAAKIDLIREGDKPGPVFVMLDGWAMRYKILPNGSRQILAFLMPGDACDLHVNLLDQMDHHIQTITPAVVAKVARVEMDQLMDRYPAVGRAMYVAQLADEGTLRAWITSMGRRSSHERVAHLLCELYLRARTIGLTWEGPFQLPLSQIVLADALGMTPVHLNRVVKKLRADGAVEISRGHVVIVDTVALAHVAGFDGNYLHRRGRQIA